jgi:hypothetical protein
METNIEAPRPEAPPYNWPNHDLKNLVLLAPTSPYTRALLRIKFNCPVPDGATTFEQIEAWLAEIKPVAKPAVSDRWQPDRPTRSQLLAQEIERGEYIEVTGEIEGYELRREYYSQTADVRVPLSIWLQAIMDDDRDDLEQYVADRVRDASYDYHDSEHYDNGDETSFEIEDDLDTCTEEAQRMLEERGLI